MRASECKFKDECSDFGALKTLLRDPRESVRVFFKRHRKTKREAEITSAELCQLYTSCFTFYDTRERPAEDERHSRKVRRSAK